MKALYWLSGISLVTAAAIGTGAGIKIEHEKNARRGLENIQRMEKKLDGVNNKQDCENQSGLWSTVNTGNHGCYTYNNSKR